MGWEETLKMVYNDNWKLLKDYPLSEDNPYAILTAPELPNEKWENFTRKSWKRTFTQITSNEGLLASNLGRVKENGKIIKPVGIGSGPKIGVKFEGDKGKFDDNTHNSSVGYGAKHWARKGRRSKFQEQGTGFTKWQWGITVNWALANNIDIPDDTVLMVGGNEIGTYGQFKNTNEIDDNSYTAEDEMGEF